MNFGDDEFNQAVDMASYAPEHLINKALLAAMEKIEELEKENEYYKAEFNFYSKVCSDQDDKIETLEACLAEKDEALERNTHPHIESMCKERCEKALVINPNQYQERVMARERVIEAARQDCGDAGEVTGPIYHKNIREALAELDKLEGDGK